MSNNFPIEFKRSMDDTFWSRQLPLTSLDWWKGYCDNLMSVSKPSLPFQWEMAFIIPFTNIPASVSNSGISVNEVMFTTLPLTYLE